MTTTRTKRHLGVAVVYSRALIVREGELADTVWLHEADTNAAVGTVRWMDDGSARLHLAPTWSRFGGPALTTAVENIARPVTTGRTTPSVHGIATVA